MILGLGVLVLVLVLAVGIGAVSAGVAGYVQAAGVPTQQRWPLHR